MDISKLQDIKTSLLHNSQTKALTTSSNTLNESIFTKEKGIKSNINSLDNSITSNNTQKSKKEDLTQAMQEVQRLVNTYMKNAKEPEIAENIAKTLQTASIKKLGGAAAGATNRNWFKSAGIISSLPKEIYNSSTLEEAMSKINAAETECQNLQSKNKEIVNSAEKLTRIDNQANTENTTNFNQENNMPNTQDGDGIISEIETSVQNSDFRNQTETENNINISKDNKHKNPETI